MAGTEPLSPPHREARDVARDGGQDGLKKSSEFVPEMSPVSVDRVGTYFRKALAIPTSGAQSTDSPPGFVQCLIFLIFEGIDEKPFLYVF